MSDERADAIPESRGGIPGEAIAAFIVALEEAGETVRASVIVDGLIAAAPHMAGSGEAERLRGALTRIADGDVDGVGDYSECVQLYARQVLNAQPDAERAPQPEPRQDSLTDQMRDVMRLAVEAGCYDAHEWLRVAFPFPESSRLAPSNDNH